MAAPATDERDALVIREAREARARSAGRPMTKAEYALARARVVSLARLTLDLDFERLLLTTERPESLAPFIDPTLYRRFLADDGAQAELKTLTEMARALLHVRSLAEQLIDDASTAS